MTPLVIFMMPLELEYYSLQKIDLTSLGFARFMAISQDYIFIIPFKELIYTDHRSHFGFRKVYRYV